MTDNYTCVWTTEDRETSHQRHQIAPETSHADALVRDDEMGKTHKN